MKKYILCVLTGMLAFSFLPNTLNATTTPVSAVSDPAQSQIVLASRLNEISTMDQSEMTRDQKKELRQEERSIKQSMSDGSGGIYISVVGLLLIILILVILL
jgi:hypothetical protein